MVQVSDRPIRKIRLSALSYYVERREPLLASAVRLQGAVVYEDRIHSLDAERFERRVEYPWIWLACSDQRAARKGLKIVSDPRPLQRFLQRWGRVADYSHPVSLGLQSLQYKDGLAGYGSLIL